MSADEHRLAKFNAARRALAEATRIDEVKQVRDQAEALRLYVKQQKGTLQMQNQCAEIKLRAERRAGEILGELGQVRRGRPGKGDMMSPLSEIGISKKQSSRWQAEAAIPEAVFEGYVETARGAGDEITQAGLLRSAARRRAELKRRDCEEIRRRPAKRPDGKYRCIVVDPPWPMGWIHRDARPKQAGLHYPTMAEAELEVFPIRELAQDDCHLYLWTTHKFLPMAFRLAPAWGFKYQCLMTWVKNVGMTPFSWMYSTEHVLFCRRGNPELLRKGLRLDFSAKVREHSRKPDEFYDIVRRASPGPRIDVFSREKRDGFDQYGNEPDRF